MRPQNNEDLEDEAAEEENKIINEVSTDQLPCLMHHI